MPCATTRAQPMTAAEPVLRADWPAPANVRAFTTLRHGSGGSKPPFDTFNLGNFRADDGDAVDTVMRNRVELVHRLSLPSSPHWLQQVHGVEVVRFEECRQSADCDSDLANWPKPLPNAHPGLAVDESCANARGGASQAASSNHSGRGTCSEAPDIGHEPVADSSVTSTPGVVLAILTADCLPMLFSARDGREIAAAHAGWRGLLDGVLEATIAAMRTPASELIVWLGPAAGPADYEVGIDVYDAFVSRDWCAGSAFVSTRPLHWRVDLYALARMRLAACGVDATRVFGGGLSTIGDPQHFFSHRRDRRSGRMASVIWMRL